MTHAPTAHQTHTPSHTQTYGEVFLEGNFAPVAEEHHQQALTVVEGSVPPELDGAFMRVGPNPALPPVGGYHW